LELIFFRFGFKIFSLKKKEFAQKKEIDDRKQLVKQAERATK
jgi:hypothetical protein